MEKQNNKYFTIWYGVYRRSERSLAYCNAGHPPPLLWTGPTSEDVTLKQLTATDTVIGMCPPGMDFQTERVKLDPYAMLMVYSNGAYEVETPAGEMWTIQEFVEFVS